MAEVVIRLFFLLFLSSHCAVRPIQLSETLSTPLNPLRPSARLSSQLGSFFSLQTNFWHLRVPGVGAIWQVWLTKSKYWNIENGFRRCHSLFQSHRDARFCLCGSQSSDSENFLNQKLQDGSFRYKSFSKGYNEKALKIYRLSKNAHPITGADKFSSSITRNYWEGLFKVFIKKLMNKKKSAVVRFQVYSLNPEEDIFVFEGESRVEQFLDPAYILMKNMSLGLSVTNLLVTQKIT